MSREETKRYPLRNCIRPDTYRYCLDGEVFPEAWEKLAKQFGRIRRFGELDLYEINGMSFLLRASYGTSSITVIKKMVWLKKICNCSTQRLVLWSRGSWRREGI